MFSVVRVLLALLVALSHLGYQWGGERIGTPAVMGFFMLSGYFMASLFTRHYGGISHGAARFYLDRALRIYVPYYFVLLLTVAFVAATGISSFSISAETLAANLLVVPLNYYMYVDGVLFPELRFWAVPTAWWLGLEIQFYLLVPLLLRWPRLRNALAVASFVLFWWANLGGTHATLLGYRLPPGTLFIFILGLYLHEGRHDTQASSFGRLFARMVWLSALAGLVAMKGWGLLSGSLAFEELFGLAVGLPLLALLIHVTRRARWEAALGGLAYGIFLNHFLARWIHESAFHAPGHDYRADLPGTLGVLALSVGLAVIGYLAAGRPITALLKRRRAERAAVAARALATSPAPTPDVLPSTAGPLLAKDLNTET